MFHNPCADCGNLSMISIVLVFPVVAHCFLGSSAWHVRSSSRVINPCLIHVSSSLSSSSRRLSAMHRVWSVSAPASAMRTSCSRTWTFAPARFIRTRWVMSATRSALSPLTCASAFFDRFGVSPLSCFASCASDTILGVRSHVHGICRALVCVCHVRWSGVRCRRPFVFAILRHLRPILRCALRCVHSLDRFARRLLRATRSTVSGSNLVCGDGVVSIAFSELCVGLALWFAQTE